MSISPDSTKMSLDNWVAAAPPSNPAIVSLDPVSPLTVQRSISGNGSPSSSSILPTLTPKRAFSGQHTPSSESDLNGLQPATFKKTNSDPAEGPSLLDKLLRKRVRDSFRKLTAPKDPVYSERFRETVESELKQRHAFASASEYASTRRFHLHYCCFHKRSPQLQHYDPSLEQTHTSILAQIEKVGRKNFIDHVKDLWTQEYLGKEVDSHLSCSSFWKFVHDQNSLQHDEIVALKQRWDHHKQIFPKKLNDFRSKLGLEVGKDCDRFSSKLFLDACSDIGICALEFDQFKKDLREVFNSIGPKCTHAERSAKLNPFWKKRGDKFPKLYMDFTEKYKKALEKYNSELVVVIADHERDFWNNSQNQPYLADFRGLKNKFVELNFQKGYKRISRLLSESIYHVFRRFELIQKVFATFLDGYRILLEMTGKTHKAEIHAIIRKNSLEGGKLYRQMQGGHIAEIDCTKHHEKFVKFVTPFFPDLGRQDLEMQAAHRMPAPGIFSPEYNYDSNNNKGNALTVATLKGNRITKKTFDETPEVRIQRWKDQFKEVIEKHSHDFNSYIGDAIFLLMLLPLTMGSETEDFPGIINNFDHFSECEIDSSPSRYKDILADALDALMNRVDADEPIDNRTIVQEISPYLNKVSAFVKKKLKQPCSSKSVRDLMARFSLHTFDTAVRQTQAVLTS